MRGIGLATWRAAKANPERAGAVLRRSLREARALHSRERRLVADLLYELIRQEQVLGRALGTADPEILWDGVLVLRGLPAPDDRWPWESLADLSTARDRATLGLGPLERLAVIAGVPVEVAAELERAFGEQAQAFVDASNARAPVVLRARGDRQALIARLADEGVQAEPSPVSARGVRVVGRTNLQALPSFREGRFEVQDDGSQRLAELAQAEGTVVDFCAGAGGKTLAMAGPGVRLIALDVRTRALDELRKRARRAGVAVDVRPLGPPGDPLPVAAESADRVLVDAPCSGTGTWRRHPELRWRLSARWLDALGRTQREVLERAATLVKPGGRLIYGTCSVLPRENEDVVAGFLSCHPGFALRDTLRLAPHTDDTDGFYGAALERAG